MTAVEHGRAVSGRGHEVPAQRLGQRPDQRRDEFLAQPGHLPVEPVGMTWLSTASGMWTVTPSASAPGSNW